MKKVLPFAILQLLFFNFSLYSQSGGEQVFKTICAACHTINKGRLVGPDLSGVYKIRDNDWLIKFIRSSQTLVKSGDTASVAIFNEFNKIPMPDNNLTDDQILGVIEYIKQQDQGAPAATAEKKSATDTSAARPDSLKAKVGAPAAATDTTKYNENEVQGGRALFYGFTAFTNGAATCISCHNIQDQTILGGGKLALDLTGSFTKLGPQGIRAILTNPPFPAMKAAIKNQLTEDEINSILAMLKYVGEQSTLNKPFSASVIFFTLGFVCALFLLVHIYLFYDNRKIPESIPGTEPEIV